MSPETPPAVETHTKGSIHARLGWVVFLAGMVAAVIAVRSLPPAPIFSPSLGRATYWQSYETAYFASVRAFEEPIRDLLAGGYIPIIIFGDSTIRGAGATGDEVWTRQLEKRLQSVNPRVRVLNYAQNAGDLMGPFLYHHLQKKFPQARYIVQWHFSSEVGIRHQFHFWLTSEIALRDGDENPAVRRSFKLVPVTRPDERNSFVLSAFNIATNYLDVGNWARYLWLGRPFHDSDRRVKVSALRAAAESDISQTQFIAPDEKQAESMRGYFLSHQAARASYVKQPHSTHASYFAEMFPAPSRSHLLLLTLDFNPYYAPHEDSAAMDTWRTMWVKLRADMADLPDLPWLSLTGSAGDMEADDFVDLGHLTVSGQSKLAAAVANKLLGTGGWFDPATPSAVQSPPQLSGKWNEIRELTPDERRSFEYMTPRPTRFYSSFGPGLDSTLFNAHPETRLCFQVPAGQRHLRTTVRINPSAYENLPENDATDGIQVEIVTVTGDGQRTVVFTREIDPYHFESDRGDLPVDVASAMPADAEVELFIGPGKNGRDTRDWTSLGPLTIK